MRLASLRLAAVATVLAVGTPAAVADDSPKVRAVKPTSAQRGGTVDVEIEGSNLHPFEDVKTTRNEIGLVTQAGSTPNKITVRLVISDDALPGPVPIVIRTKYGGTTTEKFSVRMRSPTVMRLSPNNLPRGTEADVKLEGTNLAFLGEESKVTTTAPATVAIVGKPTATSMTLHVVVPTATPPGPLPLVLETTDGKFTASLTVNLAPPTITGITPPALSRGTTVESRIAGKNLAGAMPVVLAVSDGAVTVVAKGPPTTAAIPLSITAKPDAVPGPRVLVVRTPDGMVTTRFDVTTPTLKFAGVKPTGAVRGSDVALTAGVEGAAGAFGLRVLPADPGAVIEARPSGAFTLRLASDARPGVRSIVYDHPFGAGVVPFIVTLRSPTVAAITPAELEPGSAGDVVVEGQALDGATITLATDDPSVVVTRKSSGVVHVAVAADAKPGPRPLVVRTIDGAAVTTFLVKGPPVPAPLIVSILPARIPRGRPVDVVIAGQNLRSAGDQPPAVTANVGGAAVPAKVVESSASSLKVRLEPPPDAGAGACVIVVRTSEGVAATTTSVVPAAPSIASVTPDHSLRPGNVSVTIAGADLVGPDGKAPSVSLARPDGVALLAATVSSSAPDKLVVTLPLDEAMATGPRVLVVSTSEGGTAVPFTIDAAAPVVDSSEPATVGSPADVVFTLRGRNLLAPGGKRPVVQVTRLGSAAALRTEIVDSKPDVLAVRVLTTAGIPTGPHVLVVKTADGFAAGVFEIVEAPMPIIAAITPASGPRLATVTVMVDGTGLAGATAVTFSGTGVTATLQPGATEKRVPLRVTIAKDATPGPRIVTITAPGGQSTGGKLVFTVE